MKAIDFKVNSEPLAGASLTNIIRLLVQNKFRVHPKYWPRLIYSILLSLITAPLRIVESIKFNKKIKNMDIREDPIFVIGSWRTGTTYLMTLLSFDKTKGYISNVEAYCPHYFLAFPKFTNWLLDFSLPETRPMDNVKLSPEGPNEEEYSIGAYDKYAFYNGFIFPKNFERYVKYLTFEDCSEEETKNWKERYRFIAKKVQIKHDNKQIIFKNPANTGRIEQLLEMFPNAKFIYMYRHPYTLYGSLRNFYTGLMEIYALQNFKEKEIIDRILATYVKMDKKFEETRELIPPENLVEVQYEQFIKKPLENIKAIYSKFNLAGFNEYKDKMLEYVDSQEDYEPNKHKLDPTIKQKINEKWPFLFEKYNYEQE